MRTEATFADSNLISACRIQTADAHTGHPPPTIMISRRWDGPQEIGQSVTAFFAAVEPLAFELGTMLETDGQVLTPGRYASRFHPSGQVLESEMILRFTVTDGLITDYRVFEDSLGITRTHLGEPLTTTPP